MADFRSDTVTRPTKAMREAMMLAEVSSHLFLLMQITLPEFAIV